MANEINLNLEKLDILQVHANKQLILEAQETTSLLSKERHSKLIYKCRGNKIFSNAAWKSRNGSSSIARETKRLDAYCQIQQDNLENTIKLLKLSCNKKCSTDSC
jgi:hypothetical protein